MVCNKLFYICFLLPILNKLLMKNIILIVALIFTFATFAQTKVPQRKSVTFSQKLANKKGPQLVLKAVENDSRCPEGVNCIWAGECEIQVAVYKDKKLVSTETVTLSPKLQKENMAWIKEYYPKLNITEISVLPYPKSEVVTNPKSYFVKLFLD